MKKIETHGVPGIVIEAGCALGGSALVIADAKAPSRPFIAYDVFGMPPGPSAGDGEDVHARYAIIAEGRSEGIDGALYYGYVDGLLERVAQTFRDYGFDFERDRISLVQGLLQDRLCGNETVALAHIDCDRYESVKTCLERIGPRLAQGGRMIIDDYDSKSGCRRAVDEYFAERDREFRFARKSRLHVIRREGLPTQLSLRH